MKTEGKPVKLKKLGLKVDQEYENFLRAQFTEEKKSRCIEWLQSHQ